MSATPDTRAAHVHEVQLRLADGVDPTEPGAAVTTALCGRPRHPGPCRWPHHTAARGEHGQAVVALRTVFIASDDDAAMVRSRIDEALRAAAGWAFLASGPRAVSLAEVPLVTRLADAAEH